MVRIHCEATSTGSIPVKGTLTESIPVKGILNESIPVKKTLTEANVRFHLIIVISCSVEGHFLASTQCLGWCAVSMSFHLKLSLTLCERATCIQCRTCIAVERVCLKHHLTYFMSDLLHV